MSKIYPRKLTEDMVKNASKITVKYERPTFLGDGMDVYFIDSLKNVDFWEKRTSAITGTKIEPKRYVGTLNEMMEHILSWNNAKDTEYRKNVQFVVETKNTMSGRKTIVKKPARKVRRA